MAITMQNLRLTDDEETSEPVTDPEEPNDLVVLELVESAIDVPLALPVDGSTEKEDRTNKKRSQPPITDFFSKKYINKKWIHVKKRR